jgi:hypothetical protein
MGPGKESVLFSKRSLSASYNFLHLNIFNLEGIRVSWPVINLVSEEGDK